MDLYQSETGKCYFINDFCAYRANGHKTCEGCQHLRQYMNFIKVVEKSVANRNQESKLETAENYE